MSATWVILGSGYTGARLAERLRARGDTVIATSRSAGGDRVVDVHAPGALGGWIPPGAIIVDSVPPDLARGPHAAAVCAAAAGARVVYLSTTGVYPRGDGSWVDEDTPVAPEGERGRARLAAEQIYLAARDIDARVLRIAAIYGPGRGVHERLRAGGYRVPGDGQNWVSRIHVDDLVSAIVAAGERTSVQHPIYCIADDEPCRAREHADGLAARLGLPPPPSVPLAELSPLAAELAGSNRRIRNARMKAELGVTMAYPTWRTFADIAISPIQ